MRVVAASQNCFRLRLALRRFDQVSEYIEKGLLVRTTGDIMALSPPLIITRSKIDQLFDILTDVLTTTP